MSHEINSDGRTVWINTDCCLGRFSRRGIDIHKSLAQQVAGTGECLYCTHEEPTAKDWITFQEKMKELHGIEVGDEHRPVWLPLPHPPGTVLVNGVVVGKISAWPAGDKPPVHCYQLAAEPAKLLDVRYDDVIVSATQVRPAFESVLDRPVPPDEERVELMPGESRVTGTISSLVIYPEIDQLLGKGEGKK